MVRSALLLLMVFAAASVPAAPRSSAARAAFVREHPCPSTGKARGACPGWVVDHITPLCAGGPDDPKNMQWQTVEDGVRKDKTEWAMCRRMNRVSQAGGGTP